MEKQIEQIIVVFGFRKVLFVDTYCKAVSAVIFKKRNLYADYQLHRSVVMANILLVVDIIGVALKYDNQMQGCCLVDVGRKHVEAFEECLRQVTCRRKTFHH